MGQHHETLRGVREPTRSPRGGLPDRWEGFMSRNEAETARVAG